MPGRPRRARLLRLAASIAVLAGSLMASAPSRGLCFYSTVSVIIYFSDATYTTSTGNCKFNCDGDVTSCTGTQTQYTHTFYQRCSC